MALDKATVTADFNKIGNSLDRLDTASSKFRRKSGSIVSAAKGNIFEFPVFISNSVPLDYATATTSLLEQVYASYLQMAISINPIIDSTKAVNGLQFSGLRSTTNKYLEYTDTMYQHDFCHAEYVNDDGVFVEFNLLGYDNSDAKVLLESVDYQPLEEFSHYFTEDAKDDIINKQNRHIQAERKRNKELSGRLKSAQYTANINAAGAKREKETAAKNAQLERDLDRTSKEAEREKERLTKANESIQQKLDDLQSERQAAKDAMEKAADERAKEKHEKELEKLDQEIEKNKDALEKNKLEMKKLGQDISKNDRDAKWDAQDRRMHQGDLANKARIKAPTVLRASDMDKLNSMKPILMSVDLNVMAKDGTMSPVEYVIGVKTFNRMIDADTIPEVVQYPLKEMNKLTRKAKWRAGELKFFSDIVFRIKQKKQTAVDKRDPKRKWYRRLYELAHMKGDAPTVNVLNGGSVIGSFIMDKRGKTTSASGLIPNVTMVISKADVDICKMETGIDLLNGRTAAKFCNELFMMGLCVIDTDNERVSVILPELHNDYDVHSIASLNHQLASLDASSSSVRDYFKAINR